MTAKEKRIKYAKDSAPDRLKTKLLEKSRTENDIAALLDHFTASTNWKVTGVAIDTTKTGRYSVLAEIEE